PPPPPPPPPPQQAAEEPKRPGSSVRPPPISLNSWAELGARTSQVHAPVYATPTHSMAPAELPSWEQETARLGPPLPPRPLTLEPGAPPPPPTAAAAPAPKPLAELEQALLKVQDRDQLLDVSFEIASRFARVVALFIVHRGMVQGVRCLEDGVTRSIQGVLMPLESSSMLTQAIAGGLPFRTDPRARPLDARVQHLLSERTTTEVSLFPVSLKTRVVNLLYASQGVEPIGTISFGALSLLADQMGAAYGQLILQRKG
ncbi:MAG TPA: hypothetical protein VJR89_01755, partial [Polyangiales bacterium]|nr:hypothetical protein [Polyangiales bacterium]